VVKDECSDNSQNTNADRYYLVENVRVIKLSIFQVWERKESMFQLLFVQLAVILQYSA